MTSPESQPDKLTLAQAQQIKRVNVSLLRSFARKHNFNDAATRALLQTLAKCVGHASIKTDSCGKKPLQGALKNRKRVYRYHFRHLCVINYVIYRVDSARLSCVPRVIDITSESQNHKTNKRRAGGIKR